MLLNFSLLQVTLLAACAASALIFCEIGQAWGKLVLLETTLEKSWRTETRFQIQVAESNLTTMFMEFWVQPSTTAVYPSASVTCYMDRNSKVP